MNSTLRQCGVKDHYRSDTDDIVADFFAPCLSVASRYDRAVGYFTSTSLALAANGIQRLADNGGVIRLIASPHLTPEDIEQIDLGYTYREVVERAILRELGPQVEDTGDLVSRLGLLGRLIGDSVLEIRIALVRRGGAVALYHEKIGVISDRYGNQVAFNGSSNETARAFIHNFESIEVFRSWDQADLRRVRRLAQEFERLWNSDTPNVEVLEFPELGRERLLALAAKSDTAPGAPRDRPFDAIVPLDRASLHTPRLPEQLVVRDYQREAVRQWFAHNGRGVFEMATGTGKTITALTAVTKLAEALNARGNSLLAVVVAPQLNLVDQWDAQARAFGMHPLRCYDDSAAWLRSAHALLGGLSASSGNYAMVITTNATLGRAPFQQFLSSNRATLALVADEAHNLGARTYLTKLPAGADYRLALSATPERWFDPEGTQALRDYFGETLIRLGLREAIAAGALCQYDYRPVLVPLEPEESEAYTALCQKIGIIMARGPTDGDPDDQTLSAALRRRANILAHARGKIEALRREMSQRSGSPFQLVYCAEGSRPATRGEQAPRQVEEALRMLGRDLDVPCHPYTSLESRGERSRILSRFRTGELRALVSMRCLDEGVDVPDARIAYLLASSTNPRQFIQRRGRVLRLSTPDKTAEIIDFIAVPTGHVDRHVERKLLRREVARFVEFASCAHNAGEALAVMRPLRIQYHLMDV